MNTEFDTTLESIPIAPLPVPNPTQSYWLFDEPNSNHHAERGALDQLPTELQDVVIIGTGISGISALYHLIEQLSEADLTNGFSITVLEARAFCSGATGRNGGRITPFGEVSFGQRLKRFDLETALASVHLERECTAFIANLAKKHSWPRDLIEPVVDVTLFASEEEARVIRDSLEAARTAGISIDDYTWLSETELKETYGSVGIHSALHKSTESFGIHPVKVVNAIYDIALQMAEKKGIQVYLHTQTPVHSIESSDTTNVLRIQTSRGVISGHQILHATNAYASHLLPNLMKTHPIIPTRGQVVSIETSETIRSSLLTTCFGINDGWDYFTPRSTFPGVKHRPTMTLGGGRQNSTHEVGCADDTKLNSTIGIYQRQLLPSLFPDSFPGVLKGILSWFRASRSQVDVLYEWSGIMGFSKDTNPVVGPLYFDNVRLSGQFISAGFHGHGMPRAPFCAKATVEIMLCERRNTPYKKPEWLPRRYLMH